VLLFDLFLEGHKEKYALEYREISFGLRMKDMVEMSLADRLTQNQ
jgi:hypothetical protein